jgi:hypothetical protein
MSVDIFAGPAFYPYPYYYPSYYPSPYVYAPPACSWRSGYWVNQPYVNAWGRYTYVQQWVPAQQVC